MSLFHTTHWSVVLDAAEGGQSALQKLCEAYWPPLFAYALRRGLNVEDARDVTQGFFAAMLEKDWLQRADEERGRFRSFLLRAMQRFINSEWRRENAAKRGGSVVMLALDDAAVAAEASAVRQTETDTPEEAYDRRWAALLLERAMRRLEREITEAGRGEWFQRLRPFLEAPGTNGDYAEAGGPLGLSENAVAQAVLRLRARYREAVRAEIAETLADPAAVDEEMAALAAVFKAR